MGQINFRGITPNSFQKVNLDLLWKKHCRSEEMTDSEFISFTAELSSTLGIVHQVNEAVKIFERLKKGKYLDCFRFKEEFSTWSDQVIKDLEGIEVLESKPSMTKITKTYEIKVPTDRLTYKKFQILNPDSYTKILKVVSSDSSILTIRTPILKIESKQEEYVKFKIKAFKDCEVFIHIVHDASRMAEETLSVKILVEERPTTPNQSASGNLKKNKSWNFTPRRPSPKRNSIDN